jgi:putative ABC transport system substrate-binding protein
MPVIGFVNGGTPEGYAPMVAAFRQGLNESGYVEGQNVAVESSGRTGGTTECLRWRLSWCVVSRP